MFLKLIHSQFPELFDVTTLLLEEENRFSSSAVAQSSHSSQRRASGSPFKPLITTPHMTSVESSAWVETHYKSLEQHLLYPEDAIKGKQHLSALFAPTQLDLC